VFNQPLEFVLQRVCKKLYQKKAILDLYIHVSHNLMSYWSLRIIESSFKVTSIIINGANKKEMKLDLIELRSLRQDCLSSSRLSFLFPTYLGRSKETLLAEKTLP